MADAEHYYLDVLATSEPDTEFETTSYTTGPVVGFVVDDVVVARAELADAGVEILDEICWLTVGRIRLVPLPGARRQRRRPDAGLGAAPGEWAERPEHGRLITCPG